MLAGPVSKASHFARGRAGPQQRDVRDAAEIERDAIFIGAREQQRIDARNERRTLATCDRIGAPEIVTDGRAGHFANRECVAQLQA